jgi:hypothetical protein
VMAARLAAVAMGGLDRICGDDVGGQVVYCQAATRGRPAAPKGKGLQRQGQRPAAPRPCWLDRPWLGGGLQL